MAVAFSEREAQETWSHVLERARGELPESTLVMWFSEVRATSLRDDVLELAVPSALVRERLQHNHLGLIEDAAG
jgi:chromosomal replication initiation ATPase DnaA